MRSLESLSPASYREAVNRALAEMAQSRVIARVWEHDHTLWRPDPAEIANRLGWLDSPTTVKAELSALTKRLDAIRAEGYSDILLLGMGGSSLAPEVLGRTLRVSEGPPHLRIIDTTDPTTLLGYAKSLDPAKTLFIVATKSGGTVETLSAFKYFYNWTGERIGYENAGGHFIAITDPGSRLEEMAGRYQFRDCFLNDPNIGGRYSALSLFGLVPAGLIGIDIGKLLDRGQAMAEACGPTVPEGENPGAILGATLGAMAEDGRDKLTFILSPRIASFGDWAEQLIAESTGKAGKGILPVVGESPGEVEGYEDDRLFVYLKLGGDGTYDAIATGLEQADQPVIRLAQDDTYDLGGQFFLWEMATAVAGHRIGIHPFDQPNVEAAKVLAREMVAAYLKSGQLPHSEPILSSESLAVYSSLSLKAKSPVEALAEFLSLAGTGAYVAIQAYLPMTEEETGRGLAGLRGRIRERTRLATTLGYGPRYLHSTGQLHKGDAGRGLFIQITADDPEDAPIPDEAGKPGSSISFGVLKAAQAEGDMQALVSAGRKAIRFHLGVDSVMGIAELSASLAQ